MVKIPKRYFTLLAAAALSFPACTLKPAETSLFLGNYAFDRGEYQEATVRYLSALDTDADSRDWVNYNIGNVYYSLGEVEAAEVMWLAASRTRDPRLLFAINFNRGVASYHQGDYQAAFALFREALLLDHGSREAKLNLEMAQRKLQAEELLPVQSSAVVPSVVPQAEGFDSDRLFDYVKDKEALSWQKASPASERTTQGGAW